MGHAEFIRSSASCSAAFGFRPAPFRAPPCLSLIRATLKKPCLFNRRPSRPAPAKNLRVVTLRALDLRDDLGEERVAVAQNLVVVPRTPSVQQHGEDEEGAERPR